eukprot:2187569-Rhodomonas_salina.1
MAGDRWRPGIVHTPLISVELFSADPAPRHTTTCRSVIRVTFYSRHTVIGIMMTLTTPSMILSESLAWHHHGFPSPPITAFVYFAEVTEVHQHPPLPQNSQRPSASSPRIRVSPQVTAGVCQPGANQAAEWERAGEG